MILQPFYFTEEDGRENFINFTDIRSIEKITIEGKKIVVVNTKHCKYDIDAEYIDSFESWVKECKVVTKRFFDSQILPFGVLRMETKS